MNKLKLVQAVVNRLHREDTRKIITLPKSQFRIMDEEGNEACFSVKQQNKEVMYTKRDVLNIINAAVDETLDSMRRGEPVSIYGFGTLKLHKRAKRKIRIPGTEDDWAEVAEHLVPKFECGKDLSMAVRSYDHILRERGIALGLIPAPFEDEDEFDEDEDEDDISDEEVI